MEFQCDHLDLVVRSRWARGDCLGFIVYKFTNLSRQEIEAMLGTKLEETRVYREAREEERQAIALNLLRENIPLETIARTTGLTITQLQQLQNENR